MTGKMNSKWFIYLDGRERERRCQKDGSACESNLDKETLCLLGQSDERIGETKESHKVHAEQMVGQTFCRHRYAARHAAGTAKVPDAKIIIEEAE